MEENRRTCSQGKMGSSRILGLLEYLPAAGFAIGISALSAYLFYHSFWGLCSLPIIFVLARRLLRKEKRKKEIKRLNLEFKDYMYAVSGALAAGNSIERAFLSGLRDMRQLYGESSVLAERLSGMERRLSVQEPIERILSDFAEASGSEDIENFVEIFCCAKRSGGDFLQIISVSVGRICDKMEIMEEIRTVMAEKSLEQKVMCVVPLGILLFFKVSSPEFIGKLYGNLPGAVFMTAALLLYGLAFFLGMKIVEIEV